MSPSRSCYDEAERTTRASGPARPASSSTGSRTGTRSSSGSCRSPSGSSAARSTSRTTASTATSTAGRGRPGRVPLGGRAGRHPHHHLRRPARRGAEVRQRAEVARRGEGRPRRHLHADDPRAAGRHARLRPHRRAALGGLRRVLPRLAQRPHQRRRVQGRSSPPTAATAAGAPALLKPNVDAALASTPVDRARRRRQARRRARRDGRRAATTGGTTSWRGRTPTARPSTMDSEDLLYLLYTSGTTAKPKGIMHTTGGYLTQVAFTHKYVFDLHPDDRRLLVRRRHRLGHRPQLHRLRAARQRRHVGDLRGHARHARQGPAVGRSSSSTGSRSSTPRPPRSARS